MADQIIVEDSVAPIDHAVISELAATQQGGYPQGLANPVTPQSARGIKRKSGVSGGERGTHGGFKPKSHFTESENVMLVELIIRNRSVLKSRRPEAQVERANAFDEFTRALNEMNPSSPKTVLQVRKKMDNLVSRVKKLIEEHREVGYVKNKIPVYLINLANEFILWSPPGEEVASGHIVPSGVHDDFASTASSAAGFSHALHASSGPIQTREGMLRKRKLELECELLLEQIKKVKAENEFTEARFGRCVLQCMELPTKNVRIPGRLARVGGRTEGSEWRVYTVPDLRTWNRPTNFRKVIRTSMGVQVNERDFPPLTSPNEAMISSAIKKLEYRVDAFDDRLALLENEIIPPTQDSSMPPMPFVSSGRAGIISKASIRGHIVKFAKSESPLPTP
ncbi:hypothetical protein FOL47_002700 [Perkinsus chesapeaki]|uniref:Myb/SANT-like DNA-binding domain-containing protein n=1 Tax=Perkinsus chesapeaki TaxID=330153 RepID=A0A7J6MCL3_PERCH|nr:hypothetical protein FOL47_002700 [Perkinsus chesapeaki]